MKGSAKKITVTAVFAALSVATMYIASLLPTGQIGSLGVIALFGIAAAIECGLGASAIVYAGTSILSFLIVPNKSMVLIYILFFGYYPVLKGLAEKTKIRAVEWIIKLAVMNLALAVMMFAVSEIVFDLSKIGNSIVLAFVIFNVVFVIYDLCVTYFTGFYIEKISRRVKKN